ncbi:MAG: FAD-dependent oxidoreductase [Acidimicrobiales bacterium]|jgi:pyruvate/2-oxoglutarate dehydrogenase complex dihydrolipoamide dehydrogenase (E3) component|nr:FAD-dependent oxidoreductase [Acidimicrobiales bacterium]
MPKRIVIIGGGPAGNSCATNAARLGAEVVLVERDVIGGAAHLHDCIPSKAMIATGNARQFLRRVMRMGLAEVGSDVDLEALGERLRTIEGRLEAQTRTLLASQRVDLIHGEATIVDAHTVRSESTAGVTDHEADMIVLAAGSRPRIPDWAEIDGDRVMTTRDAYPPNTVPSHAIVIGSGVTGVEFVHLFESIGSEVTLVVSRQQVLPGKDPEVAAVLEEDFLRRGIRLFKGARATAVEREGDDVVVQCNDGRVARGSHALLAVGSIPNSETLGLENAGVETDQGYVPVDMNLRSNVPHIYAAGDLSGRLPLSSVATMQGRKIAEHAMGALRREHHRLIDYDKAASAIFTEPEIADVGLAEADAFSEGRKVRVTKVPFAASAKAMINDDSRGFVKIVSDPATGVVLGGSIVGRHAAELISVLAIAVTNGLTVSDIHESLLVHPTLSEALSDAAE